MLLEFVDVLARKEMSQKLNAKDLTQGTGGPVGTSRVSVVDHKTDIIIKKEEEEAAKYEAKKIFE